MRLSERITSGSTSSFITSLNESQTLVEERTHRILHKGDKFVNPNGVICRIIDVDKEHLLDGEPQVTYMIGNDNENHYKAKCYKMSSVNSMLLQNKYELTEGEEDSTTGEEARKTIEDQLDRNWEKKNKTGIEESMALNPADEEILKSLAKSGSNWDWEQSDVDVYNPAEYAVWTVQYLSSSSNDIERSIEYDAILGVNQCDSFEEFVTFAESGDEGISKNGISCDYKFVEEALKEYCGFDKEQRLEAYKGLWNTYRLNK